MAWVFSALVYVLGSLADVHSRCTDACGTCSMMPQEKGGVVDPSLKVYGTQNLRVIDLGIVPLTVAVHTQGEWHAAALLCVLLTLNLLSCRVRNC